MFVGGKHTIVIANSGKVANVRSFSPDTPALDIPVVDLAFLYEDYYTGRSYIMIARHALYVPTMGHNLIPPFLLREAGFAVNECPKIHSPDPSVYDHSIYIDHCNLRIPLLLHGTFSYFPTRLPTLEESEDPSILAFLITPEGPWNPQSDAYAINEASLLDWRGEIVPKNDRPQRILIETIDQDNAMIASLHVGELEAHVIDDVFDEAPILGDLHLEPESSGEHTMPYGCSDDIHLSAISSTLVASTLAAALNLQAHVSDFGASMGSTVSSMEATLFPDSVGDFDAIYAGETELDDYFVSSVDVDTKRIRGVTPEDLSKVWRIDYDTAKRTIANTSQRVVRPSTGMLPRNFSTNDRMLRYKRIHQHFFMDTFFATSKAGKSSRKNTCCQLFVTDKGFVYVVPMPTKGSVPQALKAFAKEIGAPDAIICDASGEQTSRTVKEFLRSIGTTLRVLEEGTPWSNRAELYIGIIKEAVRRDMFESNCPLPFWDYCVERRAAIHNLTANGNFNLQGRNPFFSVTGEEGDISNLCQFSFYQWVYYREQKNGFPIPKELLGRALGPSKGEGNAMAQWVLNYHGNVVPRRSVRPLTHDEMTRDAEIQKRQQFDIIIQGRWGTALTPPQTIKDATDSDDFIPYEDDDETAVTIRDDFDAVDTTGRALNQQPAYDALITAELMLPQDGVYKPAVVTGRSTNPDGHIVGTYNVNPMLNTMTYDVTFDDGEVKEYSANLIAENLLNQVDDEGFTLTSFKEIVTHRVNLLRAVDRSNMWVTYGKGQRRMRQTTEGWQLLVRWHDDSVQWIPLSIMKESNPVEVANYAKAASLMTEPAFAWWVPYTLRKAKAIIAAVNVRTRKTTHKYGIEIPRSLKHAMEIDKKNGNDIWRKAYHKEMVNVGVAFEILEDDKRAPVGWTKVTGHLIFDVRMTLERKARWVLDGHLTSIPDNISTYAGVVSRESVRIILTYAALNGLDVWCGDIRNAYTQAPSSQKDFIYCGPEFGLENVGKVALIKRALYGGKTAGRDYRNHLRECMNHCGFTCCPADPDVWMRPGVKSNGLVYWEYVLLYTDDILAVSENGERIIRDEIGKYFELKPDSIQRPTQYLGGKLRQVTLESGVTAWAYSSSQYVQAAVSNVEKYLDERNLKLPARAKTPLPTSYRPEIDTTPALNPSDAAQYQSLIGILRWIVELGRNDMCCEVSMMSSHLALPREGHLDRVYHIFAYLKSHHNAEVVYDPTEPFIDESLFERKDWSTSEMSGKGSEELPDTMPMPRGQGFVMRAYVDADHASETITRRSRTGYMVFLNGAPIHTVSKKQTSVETSSFGSEFTAMKHCTEYIRGLRYKLRMLGIPVEGPAYVFGDNKSVLYNSSIPDSILKKKSQSLSYHFVREGSARDEWRIAYVNTHENPSDLLTKPLPDGEKRRRFVRMILHHIFDGVADA